MQQAVNIVLESIKPLTTRNELAVLGAAFARKPSPTIRAKLARLLTADDQSDAIIDLYAEESALTAGEELLLGEAWLARESAVGDEAARAAADRAVAVADDVRVRAAALALRGKAETRLGDIDTARRTLTESLALDPHNKDACKRLAAIALAAHDTEAVLSLYTDLAGRGAAHSRLFAARALAHARRDEEDAARDLMGADRFFSAEKLAPPPGWDSIEDFNAALAEELMAHPELRYDRYGAASEATWRIDTMPSTAAPLARLLVEAISRAIGAYVDRCADTAHPWAVARPDDALLRSWCVITESEGFENWHVHQFGWLSGAYYVRVPDTIANGQTEGGCIAFGLPEDLAGETGAAAYGTRVIRPYNGLLLLFPSHTYHRTFPHGVRDRRICVAFDMKPLSTR